jgi:hypothetical protein
VVLTKVSRRLDQACSKSSTLPRSSHRICSLEMVVHIQKTVDVMKMVLM